MFTVSGCVSYPILLNAAVSRARRFEFSTVSFQTCCRGEHGQHWRSHLDKNAEPHRAIEEGAERVSGAAEVRLEWAEQVCVTQLQDAGCVRRKVDRVNAGRNERSGEV
jgi:hypothetical protein